MRGRVKMIQAFRRYFEVSGRSGRTEYGLFVAIQSLIGIGLFAAWVTLVLISPPGSMMLPSIGLGVGYALFLLASLVPGTTLTIRRLHDTGRSGWWLALLAPGVLAAAQTVSQALREARSTPHEVSQIVTDHATGTVLGMSALICQLTLFVYMILPGMRAANRFGEAPLRLNLNLRNLEKPAEKTDKKPVSSPEPDEAALPDRIAARVRLPDLPLKPARQATHLPEPVLLYRETDAARPYSPGVKPAQPFGRRGTS